MKCASCNTEHNDGFCPNCGYPAYMPPQANYNTLPIAPPKKKKTGCIVASIIASVLVLAFIIFVANIPSIISSVRNLPAPTGTNSGSTEVGVIGAAENLDGISVTLLGTREITESPLIDPTGDTMFLVFDFSIENNTTNSILISSLMHFSGNCDGVSVEVDTKAIAAGGANMLDGSLAAGAKISGTIGFEVPKNWVQLEIFFTPVPYSYNSVMYIATNT